MKNNIPIILSASELASLLGIRSATIRRWAKKNKIPSIILPSGRLRFNPLEVVDTLKKLKSEEIDVGQIIVSYERQREIYDVTKK